MPIRFDTTEYRFSHEREPRGRGSWAFEIPGVGVYWTPGSTTFAEAKRLAVARVRQMLAAARMLGAPVAVKVVP